MLVLAGFFLIGSLNYFTIMGNSIFVGRVSQWKLNLLTFVTLLVVSVTNQYAQDGQLSQLGVMIFAYLLTMIIGLIIALATEPTRHE